MAQYTTTKNPPWVRGTGAGPTALSQPPPPGTSLANTILAAQATNAGAAAGQIATAGVPAGTLATAGQIATAGVSAGTLATAAAVVAAAAQSQQGQAAPAVSAAYGTGLAAITLTQSALQQGAVLQQPTIGIPASLAATTQVNNGVVVELARLPQPGVALPTSLATTQVATVSYPAPRLLAQTGQFQTAQAHQQTAVVQQAAAAVAQVQSQQQQPSLKQRVFTGTVTKLHDNFGFIDEDVFFQLSTVKGNIPKAGERVIVEASYNPNMPFKWNATRVQVLPSQLNVQQAANSRAMAQPASLNATVITAPVSTGGLPIQGVGVALASNQSQFSSITQQSRWQVPPELAVIEQIGPPRMNIQFENRIDGPHPWIQDMDYQEMMDNKGPRLGNVNRRHSPPLRRDREREMRRDDRRDRYRERDRYSPPPLSMKRSRSPRRQSRSPPRRRQRLLPRYTVQIPKISLDMKEGNLLELRKRYTNLYIPSDFCSASFLWQDAFPPHMPFNLDHPCNFHIVNKDCSPVLEKEEPQEVSDVDHLYSAKVMLLASPPLKEIFKKSCGLAEDSDDTKENFVHPTRLISFIVGLKGKNETVAIGGPWSPSVDGPDPDKNPEVLIKTAIRTCRQLTGIDLSSCSQWYRFAEIHYRRGETTHKGRVLPTRIETVVLYLPDVWSCLPTRVEWDTLVSSYNNQLRKKLHEEPTDDATAEIQEEEDDQADKPEPTHFSELDPKTIKVSDLKRELEARNLSVQGLKSQLVGRLSRALKSESEKEVKDDQSTETDQQADQQMADQQVDQQVADQQVTEEQVDKPDIKEVANEEKKKEEPEKKAVKEEKEKVDKVVYTKKCQLPSNPAIIVQPSRTAKGGKFDCTVMSLSLLLDYRQEDNKEHSFEVSLFAELFNEMMMRDFGFRIYRSLVDIPDSKDEEKEKDKKKSDKKEDSKYKKDDKDDYRRKDDGDNDSDKDEDDSDDDEYDGDEKKDRERKRKRKKKLQMCTHDPYLLLSYIYYDQTHCGYLLDKDLEEILYILGLQLSRAQVRKIIQKACDRESFYYRKLTDRPVGENDKHNKESSKISIEELAFGNRKYLPHSTSPVINSQVESEKSGSEENNSTGNSNQNLLVNFQGSVVDVGKLLKQLERNEKARLEVEERLKNLRTELDTVNKFATSKDKLSQKLSQDLDESRSKLQNVEDELRKVNTLNERYVRTLQSCRDQMFATTTTIESMLKLKSSSRSSSFRGNGLRRSIDVDSSSSNSNFKDLKSRELNDKIDSPRKESPKSTFVNSNKDSSPISCMDTE